MPVSSKNLIVRFWFFLSYLITNVDREIEVTFDSDSQFPNSFNRGFVNDFFPGICKFFEVSNVCLDHSNPVHSFVLEMVVYFPARFFNFDQILIIKIFKHHFTK